MCFRLDIYLSKRDKVVQGPGLQTNDLKGVHNPSPNSLRLSREAKGKNISSAAIPKPAEPPSSSIPAEKPTFADPAILKISDVPPMVDEGRSSDVLPLADRERSSSD